MAPARQSRRGDRLHGQQGLNDHEQLAAERTCCDLMMALTEDERAAALGLAEGYWTP